MREMTPEFEFKILQRCSGDFLTECFPDNWEDMEEDERNQFMEEHVWEQMEDQPVENVYSMIESSADSLKGFLMDEGFVKDNRKKNDWEVE